MPEPKCQTILYEVVLAFPDGAWYCDRTTVAGAFMKSEAFGIMVHAYMVAGGRIDIGVWQKKNSDFYDSNSSIKYPPHASIGDIALLTVGYIREVICADVFSR